MIHILRFIQNSTSSGRIRFKKHAITRMIERKVKIHELEEALLNCKIIETYLDDKPYESYLVIGYTSENKPLHAVVAIDNDNKILWVITVYEPDRDKWNEALTKRK